MKISKFIPFLLFLICTMPVSAQDQKIYTVYRTSAQVRIDGNLNEPDWQNASWSDDFVDITGTASLKPSLKTRVKMLRDDKFLYVAAELNEPHIWGKLKQRDTVIFYDNDFEVFIDVDGNGQNYYETEINALGTVWDLLLTKAYKKMGNAVVSWNIEGLQSAVGIKGTINDPADTDSSWTVEMAFPVDFLMKDKNPLKKPANGVQWRINFSRVEWLTDIKGSSYVKRKDNKTGKNLPEQNWVWQPIGEIDMHIPEKWGRISFSSSSVIPSPAGFLNQKQKEDFRIMVWMNGHPDWSSARWDSALKDLKEKGVSCIICGGDRATLERIIPLARVYGITVEKWFITMMNNDSAIIHQHPEWFVVNREGKSSVTDPAYVGYYRFMCPSEPMVTDYLKKKVNEYLSVPGLHAIHLDYIRYPDVILPEALWSVYGIRQDKEYPQYDYCYCGRCRKKFSEKYGYDPLVSGQPDTIQEWKQFRYDQITEVVSKLAELCHENGKSMSGAVFPGPGIAKSIVRQEWNRWPLDEVMPMLYHSFYYGGMDWINAETSEGVSSLNGRIPLYSGLYIPSLNPRDLREAIIESIRGGASGVSLFNYEAMTPAHWKAIRDL